MTAGDADYPGTAVLLVFSDADPDFHVIPETMQCPILLSVT